MRWWSSLPLPVKALIVGASSAAAWVIAIQVTTTKKQHAWIVGPIQAEQKAWLIFIGAILTIIAVGFPILDQYILNRTAIASATKLIFTIDSIMTPYALLVGRLTDEGNTDSEKERWHGEAKLHILAGLTKLLERSGRTRSSYLEVTHDPERTLSEGGHFLSPMAASTGFRLSQQSKKAFLSLLDANETWFCGNIELLPPEWGLDHAGYKSIIVAPVATPKHDYGLLVVGTEAEGDLTASDKSLVTLFGTLLAAAMNT